MGETRDISLGGRTFSVPMLPLRVGKLVYPICRALTNAGIIDRAIKGGGALDVTRDEMAQLVELTNLACQAADPGLKPDDFESLPVTPPELLDAFFAIRFQTGGWKPAEPGPQPVGEGEGDAAPPTSTSTAS